MHRSLVRRPPSSRALAPCLLIALVLTALPALADDSWPQYRGPQRDGVSPATGLRFDWPEGGPPLAWERPLGSAFSSIAVVGGRLYTMTSDADEGDAGGEFLTALDAKSGAEIWRARIGDFFSDEFGDGPRATPTVGEGTVYALGSRGTLKAIDAADGKPLWSVELSERFGSALPRWGFSMSPLIDGDLLLLEVGGGEGKAIAALDRRTGETRWTTRDGQPGYSSPIVAEIDGRHYVVFNTGNQTVGVDRDGKVRWTHETLTQNYAMPLFLPPDRIVVSAVAMNDPGAIALRVTHGGDEGGEAKVEELWRAPFFRNHFSSSAIHDGHIYGFDNATLKCISAETGEPCWSKRGFGKGSLIIADGHLVVLSDQGRLIVVKASPEGYQEVASVQALDGKSWTSPTLAGGRLYLRNLTTIKSYDLGVDVQVDDQPKG